MRKTRSQIMVAVWAMIVASATQAGGDDQSVNEADTNAVVSNAASNPPLSTSASLTGSNVWQSAKEGTSNAWDLTKRTATNAWETTKKAGSNLWERTAQAIDGGPTTDISTNYYGYGYSQKSAFASEAKASMVRLDQRISNLAGRIDQQNTQDIGRRRADLGAKYEAVKSATPDNWSDTKAAFIKSYYDLRATVKTAEDVAKANL